MVCSLIAPLADFPLQSRRFLGRAARVSDRDLLTFYRRGRSLGLRVCSLGFGSHGSGFMAGLGERLGLEIPRNVSLAYEQYQRVLAGTIRRNPCVSQGITECITG
jgi:hypothetical protein